VLAGLGLIALAGVKAVVTRRVLYKGGRVVRGRQAVAAGAILFIVAAVLLLLLRAAALRRS
jgi:hypothetical protein